MTNISLRSFHRKIEDQIQNAEIDAALYNCHFILSRYPKNFHTYQLLSRAFLESQNHLIAEHVFNIILRIDPDDFIAHIGKSMIAETNGLLDLSIEHMKHAFEIQPANEGLQTEIKRLLEKKDSASPNKIILTRGALIKMYLRGKLYDQAIGEITIGLHESPNRVDYKVALAESYYELGKPIQAVETCVDIIRELPYCLKANELLNNVMNKNNDLNEKNIYLSHLIELDPYYAYKLPTTESVLDVPDIAIMVEDQGTSEYSYQSINWQEFIESCWKESQNLDEPHHDDSDLDWEAIIQRVTDPLSSEALLNLELENENVVSTDHEFMDDSLKDTLPEQEHEFSKRNGFINRLRGTQSGSIHIDDSYNILNSLEHQPHEIDSDLTYQDYQDIGQETEMDDLDQTNIIPDELFRDDLVSPLDSEWIPDEIENQEEINIGEETKTTSPAYKLHDTQPIVITDDNSDDLILGAQKALEGENFRYALNIYKSLAKQDKMLETIRTPLEDIIEHYPDKMDFLLLLGEVYTRLDDNQKALQIFQKAQKLISL